MNQLLFSILICFLAGAVAGLGTGFAGLSAATVISPMLIAFLDVPAYDAIGIALASDVFASAVSARTYAKNGSIGIKNGLAMMAGVLSMTVVGSWLSTYVEGSIPKPEELTDQARAWMRVQGFEEAGLK